MVHPSLDLLVSVAKSRRPAGPVSGDARRREWRAAAGDAAGGGPRHPRHDVLHRRHPLRHLLHLPALPGLQVGVTVEYTAEDDFKLALVLAKLQRRRHPVATRRCCSARQTALCRRGRVRQRCGRRRLHCKSSDVMLATAATCTRWRAGCTTTCGRRAATPGTARCSCSTTAWQCPLRTKVGLLPWLQMACHKGSPPACCVAVAAVRECESHPALQPGSAVLHPRAALFALSTVDPLRAICRTPAVDAAVCWPTEAQLVQGRVARGTACRRRWAASCAAGRTPSYPT